MNALTSSLPSPSTTRPPRLTVVGLAAWFAVALVVATSGVFTHLPPPAIAIVSLVGSLVWRYRASITFREAMHDLDPRIVIGFHLVRIGFGAWFLFDHARGILPGAFALVAGRGDIAVGLLAPLAAHLATRDSSAARRVVLAWNVFGLVDIVLAVVNAQRLLLVEHDASMQAAFARLPYPLLPLFVVPLVIATHLLVFARLARRTQA